MLSVGVEIFSDITAVSAQFQQGFRLDDRSVVFAELYGMKGDSDFGVFSGGLVYRRLLEDSRTFIGLNTFYDAFQDTLGYSYSQVGFGAEIGRGRYTLRGNFYVPFGELEGGVFANSVATGIGFREASTGWDAELEVSLLSKPAFLDPYVAVGYYQMWTDSGLGEFSGVRARGGMRIGRHMVADAEWRQDARGIGQEWRVGVRFEFRFGGPRGDASPSYSHRPLPAVAMGDGKSVRELEPGDGKSMRPLDGSDGSSVLPLDGSSPSLGLNSPNLPRGFSMAPRRLRFPTVVESITVTGAGVLDTLAAGGFVAGGAIGGAAVQDCGCVVGGGTPLIFD